MKAFIKGEGWSRAFIILKEKVKSSIQNTYCISGYFRVDFIFANFASRSSRKFPLQYKAIYSNEVITKIAKFCSREFPQLVKNRENIWTRKYWLIQYYKACHRENIFNSIVTIERDQFKF